MESKLINIKVLYYSKVYFLKQCFYYVRQFTLLISHNVMRNEKYINS